MLLADSFLPFFRVPLHPDAPLQPQPLESPTILLLSNPYRGRPLSWTRSLPNDPKPFSYPGSTSGGQDSALWPNQASWGEDITSQALPRAASPGSLGPLQLSLAQAGTQQVPYYLCVGGGGRALPEQPFPPRNPLSLSTYSAILCLPLYNF